MVQRKTLEEFNKNFSEEFLEEAAKAYDAICKQGERQTIDNMIGVVNPNCRLCERKLSDESDLWAGRCNDDNACKKRREQQLNNADKASQ